MPSDVQAIFIHIFTHFHGCFQTDGLVAKVISLLSSQDEKVVLAAWDVDDFTGYTDSTCFGHFWSLVLPCCRAPRYTRRILDCEVRRRGAP